MSWHETPGLLYNGYPESPFDVILRASARRILNAFGVILRALARRILNE